jgi:fumarylacetoacetase
MQIAANDPGLKSWIEVPADSDFPIQNLPLGIYSDGAAAHNACVAIGNQLLDLYQLHKLGYLDELGFEATDFSGPYLNSIMAHGKQGMRRLRNALSELLEKDNPSLRDHPENRIKVLRKQNEVDMLLPVKVGDYTDFYSSIEHATNVGTMFRDPNNALLPNWRHLPVAYHGRSSSIVVSGIPVRRPMGQTRPDDEQPPVFGPSRLLDFELELAFITFDGKPLGERISTAEADDYICGMVLFNDWSARDIQKWEYVPLGPFLAKNFASSISPWVVSLDALEPFRIAGPVQEPAVLPYLQYSGNKNIDIALEVGIVPEGGDETTVCRSNYKYMYWNMNQQLAHHTAGGCNMRCGDMLASGTISGKTPDSYGSMLEITWRGSKPVKLTDGTERKFINDGDTVVMRGHCQKNGLRIGFGEVRSKVLAAR